MASNTEGVANGYLHGLLVDGARPFSYRGRVRALLGLPESGGVEMNFSKQLPIAGFSYVVPRFTGEFEFPDELLASSPRPVIYAEERAPSDGRTAGIPPERELAIEGCMPARQAAPQIGKPSEFPMKEPGVFIPGCPAVPGAGIRSGESGPPECQPIAAKTQTGRDESSPALGTHELIVPG